MADRSGQKVGNYRITRLLGRGGFADVYLGEHLYLNTQAALKVMRAQLDEDDSEKFHAEAQTIAHLRHPHIIRVLDFAVEEMTPFLVMDYAPNGSLRSRHSKGRPIEPTVFLPYVQQIAEALYYAHNRKLIHRDVKPENMLLGEQEELLLSDFGIALLVNSQYQSTDETITGTISYMAPEQIQGKARPASDQYALAVVVYEWLCGSRPFKGSYVELVSQHLSTPPPPLHEQIAIKPAVEQVVMKALAKDPTQRFPTIVAFAQALEQAYNNHPQKLQPPPIQSPPSPNPGRLYEEAGRNPAQPVQQVTATQSKNLLSTSMPTLQPGLTNAAGSGTRGVPPPPEQTVTRKAGHIVKRGLNVLLVGLLIVALLTCGLGYLAINALQSMTQSGSGSDNAAALTVANTFLTALSQGRYEQAYATFDHTLTAEVTQQEFVQLGNDTDRCYGRITQFTKDSKTTIHESDEEYSYTIVRTRYDKSYQMQLKVQRDGGGQWHLTDYRSTLPEPKC